MFDGFASLVRLKEWTVWCASAASVRVDVPRRGCNVAHYNEAGAFFMECLMEAVNETLVRIQQQLSTINLHFHSIINLFSHFLAESQESLSFGDYTEELTNSNHSPT